MMGSAQQQPCEQSQAAQPCSAAAHTRARLQGWLSIQGTQAQAGADAAHIGVHRLQRARPAGEAPRAAQSAGHHAPAPRSGSSARPGCRPAPSWPVRPNRAGKHSKLTSAHPLERLSLLTAHHGLGCACLCAQAACLAGVRPSWQAWLERTLVERTVMAACSKPGPRSLPRCTSPADQKLVIKQDTPRPPWSVNPAWPHMCGSHNPHCQPARLQKPRPGVRSLRSSAGCAPG